MHRFYIPGFPPSGEVQLPDEEAQHLARVLRLSVGDTIAVFDGHGREAVARVQSIASRRVGVSILEPRSAVPEPAVAITLAQALLKSDKMDRVIRDSVMLGVASIQPFISLRTEIPRAALRTGVRQVRWDRTVISSVKQCGRAVVPHVLETVEFEHVLASASGRIRLMFVEPGGAYAAVVSDLRSLEGSRPPGALVLIGPEGGWDRAEIAKAVAAGVTLVTLGNRVLRADAAGVIAMAVLRYIWRDL